MTTQIVDNVFKVEMEPVVIAINVLDFYIIKITKKLKKYFKIKYFLIFIYILYPLVL